MTISNKNFTQEIWGRLHDWAVNSKDNQLEVTKRVNSENWEVWIYKFDCSGSTGSFLTDDNCDTEDFDALLKQKREIQERENYEALKKKFEKE